MKVMQSSYCINHLTNVHLNVLRTKGNVKKNFNFKEVSSLTFKNKFK
jgi:hypothetical protein